MGDIIGPLIKGGVSYIPMLAEKIHNSRNMPEYRNVYTTSERSSYAMVSDGERFRYRPKKTIIDHIIEEKRSLITAFC